MKTIVFEQAQAQTGLSAANLEQFLISYVLKSAHHAYEENSGESYLWQLAGNSNIERRLLLNYDETKSEFTVSFEVAYQLFAGDTHFVVKKVGTLSPVEIRSSLPGIVTKALEQVNSWKPTYELF